MSERSSEWNIEENTYDKKFTFAALYEQHVTSEQLFLWSAPIDVIERYQFYLNQILTKTERSLASQVFYNCTSSRFGPTCQYSFNYNHEKYSSLNDFVYDFYLKNPYKPNTLTCYKHLQCNRGSISMCLDWSEICDGIVDCTDGIDEQYCWPLETHKCDESEFQCRNGQCIPKSFVFDNGYFPDCLDGSDEAMDTTGNLYEDQILEPIFSYEDILCLWRNKLYLTPLTRSCFKQRHELLAMAMFSEKPSDISNICWSAFKCLVQISDFEGIECSNFCSNKTCEQIINNNCSDIVQMPTAPVLFGHIYFVYTKEDVKYISERSHLPQYICYNDKLCGGYIFNATLQSINNATCRHASELESEQLTFYAQLPKLEGVISLLFSELYMCNTIQNRDPVLCNQPDMYRCENSSKCISKDRLCDKFIDCEYEEDEQCDSISGTCSIQDFTDFFYCSVDQRCISLRLVHNKYCDCNYDEYDICEDEITLMDNIRKHISFPTICDGFVDMLSVTFDGQLENDETECQYWSCNNTYTRCDGFWNCFDGADEVDCNSPSLFKCPFHQHICVSPITNQFMCLPVEKANDGKIDCLGGTDEPKLCRTDGVAATSSNFYCSNGTSGLCMSSFHLCNIMTNKCTHGDDLQFCIRNLTNPFESICVYPHASYFNHIETYFCDRLEDTWRSLPIHFSVNRRKKLIEETTTNTLDMSLPHTPNTGAVNRYEQRCHRGLDIRVWLNIKKNNTITTCLCPPSYYGDMCQYQNQRVSFTVQFLVFPDSQRIPFGIIVLLIDDSNERIIHSSEQVTYLSMRDCDTKFNIYLLYSNRPKNLTKIYSIHIDIYEKISLKYRGSLLVPIDFPFLPVHRIANQLYIPRMNDRIESCVDSRCKHGQCIRYYNNANNRVFCRCNQGWSGRYCTISYTFSCASDSLCLGVSANNQPVCVCPIDKFGPRCLLQSTICHSNPNMTCYNHGTCIPINEDVASVIKFKCICPKGYSGKMCELNDTKIIISFDRNIDLPQSMIVHFVRAMTKSDPENGTTFKTIPVKQDSVTVYWAQPFHIAFLEIFHEKYYLLIVQETYKPSSTFNKIINSNDRCKHISEIYNETFAKLHPLRRIKYYHVSCQKIVKQLSCFYDEIYFCFCYQFGNQRIANCFEYNLTRKLDCFGRNHCENEGKCLQDSVNCPQTSMCVCPKCFYGTQCQFRSSGFSHSLDALIGYHILPETSLWKQPFVVKLCGILTIIMTGAGFINSIMGIITFTEESLRTNGCALYLLGSSITSLCTMIMLSFKFWTLIAAQIQTITDRLFLQIQCVIVDLILRIFLSSDQWLNACIAIEQAITAIKGTTFNKKKSKHIAKYVIFIIFFFTICTGIHEPFHRHLIDEDNGDEKRIWCIVSYSNGFQFYDSFINVFQFLIPFLINLIAAIFVITKTARQQTFLQNPQTYRRQILEQFHQQKHLILGPLLLVVLSSPSVIINLVTGCVESADDSEILLASYFMSFIPPMLTFLLFILPSKLYKEELHRILERYRLKIRTQMERFLPQSSRLTESTDL